MRKLLASLALGLAVLGFSAASFAADDAASAPAAASAAAVVASAPAASASAPATAAAPASAAASTPTIVETVNKGDVSWNAQHRKHSGKRLACSEYHCPKT